LASVPEGAGGVGVALPEVPPRPLLPPAVFLFLPLSVPPLLGGRDGGAGEGAGGLERRLPGGGGPEWRWPGEAAARGGGGLEAAVWAAAWSGGGLGGGSLRGGGCLRGGGGLGGGGPERRPKVAAA
jgi:hypothetical protein